MERLNDTQYRIVELLRRRWSPRAFDARPVEPWKLRNLFEAARWAPSASNEQPWNFIVATQDDPANFSRMLSCLVEKNQQWAKAAPVLILAVASLEFSRTNKANRHAFYDLGQAVMSMIVEATSLGLYVHQMAGFSPERAREMYQIPLSADPLAVIALGYQGDPSALPEDLRVRENTPSQRKPSMDFVFAGQWGKPAELLNDR